MKKNARDERVARTDGKFVPMDDEQIQNRMGGLVG
jgi:hypothetical protein